MLEQDTKKQDRWSVLRGERKLGLIVQIEFTFFFLQVFLLFFETVIQLHYLFLPLNTPTHPILFAFKSRASLVIICQYILYVVAIGKPVGTLFPKKDYSSHFSFS